MQDIDSIISDCINQIDEKVSGINFLEKLKYLLIDSIKSNDSLDFESLVIREYPLKNDSNNIDFIIKIQKADKNFSNIKKINDCDNLSITLNGLKTINIGEKLDPKISNNFYLSKFTGLVLQKNTIIDEFLSKDTILIIICIINTLENNIE